MSLLTRKDGSQQSLVWQVANLLKAYSLRFKGGPHFCQSLHISYYPISSVLLVPNCDVHTGIAIPYQDKYTRTLSHYGLVKCGSSLNKGLSWDWLSLSMICHFLLAFRVAIYWYIGWEKVTAQLYNVAWIKVMVWFVFYFFSKMLNSIKNPYCFHRWVCAYFYVFVFSTTSIGLNEVHFRSDAGISLFRTLAMHFSVVTL